MPSSVIARFNYDAATASLVVTFVSGMVYKYLSVPEKVFREMKDARSKGTFLNTRIKGKYDFVKLG